MGDTAEDIMPNAEEKLVKSEKIEQPSEENLPAPDVEKEKSKIEPELEVKSPERVESQKKEIAEVVRPDLAEPAKAEETVEIEKKIIAEAKLEIAPEKPKEKPLEQPKEKPLEQPKEKPLEQPKEKPLEQAKNQEIKKISDSVPCCPKPREKIIRNQSDIFSLKNISTTLQTSIFSVNGSPSRRVFRKQEPAGHVFQKNEDLPSREKATSGDKRITRENYNDEKRPSSSYRNPLTGTGLSSNDEYKSKGTKRKDGNPLLGLGYDDVIAVSSQHRIPPGGFSHKLW